MIQVIRFLQNISDEDILVWKKSYLYPIEYEDETSYYLKTESGQLYALAKSGMAGVADIYPCNGEPYVFCNHCQYIQKKENAMSCGFKYKLEEEATQKGKTNG